MARRQIVAIAAGMLTLSLAVAGCGGSKSDSKDGAQAKQGGEIIIRGCTPENPLIPSNTTEVCGGNIIDAVTSKLIHYNPKNASPEMDLAQEIITSDNINFTVKLKKGQKFSDKSEVKAKNFVDGWNWAAYGPRGQSSAYFMEPFEGYKDLQCPDDDAKCEKSKPKAEKMSGLKVIDDYTFSIKTTEPVSNLPVRLGYSAFAPAADAFLDKPTDESWGKKPLGAGPFMVESNDEKAIVLVKNPEYAGAYKPHINKVTFRIYNDAPTAYTDLLANNIDFTDVIPADQLAGDQWKAQLKDRTLVRETGIFNDLTFSPADDQFKTNYDLRKAISMAVDRQTITKQLFNGTRTPATGWVSPVVDGYKADACGDACKFDAGKAKELYTKAGGYKGTLVLSVNQEGGHKQWADAACNGWKNTLGLDCQVNVTPDFKTLRKQIKGGELKGIFRAGWQMDYPSIENFLSPIYTKGASSNDAKYDNPAFDKKLVEAASAKTSDDANRMYQEAEKMLAEQLPTAPLWYSQTPVAWSTKVTNVVVTPFSTLDLSAISVK